MTEKNYLSEFLLQLKDAKPGPLDISNIPAEELGDVLDTMHALFRFKKDQGLTVNSLLAGSLKKDEYDVLESLVQGFHTALTSGQVSYRRDVNNRIVPFSGL